VAAGAYRSCVDVEVSHQCAVFQAKGCPAVIISRWGRPVGRRARARP
jgi:hypothetical protein